MVKHDNSVLQSGESSGSQQKKSNKSSMPKDWVEYELFVTSAENIVAQTGTKGTKMIFTIRGDVEQEGKGWKVFHRFWQKKDGSEEKVFGKGITKLNLALGIENGQTFDGYEDWAKWTVGKPVRALLKYEYYNGKRSLAIAKFLPTQVKAQTQPEPQKVETIPDFFGGQTEPLSEDDLPF